MVQREQFAATDRSMQQNRGQFHIAPETSGGQRRSLKVAGLLYGRSQSYVGLAEKELLQW